MARWFAGPSVIVLGASLASPVLAAQHYVVRPGDFLYRVAHEEGVSARQLIALNHLSAPYRIYVGQTLRVRPDHAFVLRGGLAGGKRDIELASARSERSRIADAHYRVKSGDWLLHIARVEGVSVQRLARANGLASPYRVYVGQTLALPSRRGSPMARADRSHAASAEVLAEAAPAPPVTAAPLETPAPPAAAAPERQAASLVLPLYDDETRIGDVDATIDADGIVSVDAHEFADLVKSVLADASYARVKTLLASKAQIRIISIDNAGVITTYDGARQRIVMDIRPADRLADGRRQLDPAVTATGRLVDAGGAPLSLTAGQAIDETRPGRAPVPLFTTRDGRFAASGLAPGRWRITTRASPGKVFEIVIPEDGAALVRLGDIWPA
jgi:LysM repeat protein